MFGHAEKTDHPLVIAHRGASGLAPENTMAAFRLAVAMGADGFELDVQLSADGEPVVIHDAQLLRTTDRLGAVASLTAAELAACDAGAWFARRLARRPRIRAMAENVAKLTKADGLQFVGEAVPRLGDVLALADAANVERLYIELKGGRRRDKQPLLEAVLRLVNQYKIERAVTLLSFDHEIIRRAKAAGARVRTAATFAIPGRGELTARAIISAVERAEADEAALHYGLATRRTVATLHARGLAVAVWTVNSKLMMRRMLAGGVDAIMTNYPNRLKELIEQV